MAAATQTPPDLAALQELERRSMAGDPDITPDIKAKIDAKMGAYRQQGLAKPLKDAPSDQMKVSDFGTLLDTIDKADQHVGMTTAGMGGSIMQSIPGTDARDLQSTITTLKANLAFDKLQAMRAASPTGGAIGQVSDTEERMLASSVAALDQSQSQDQLRENLANVKKHYTAYINSLGLDVTQDPKTGSNIVAPHAPTMPTAIPGANNPPAGGPGSPPNDNVPKPLDPDGTGDIGFATGGDNSLKLAGRLTSAQESDAKAFLATKPDADAILKRYELYGQTITPESAAKVAEYYAKGGNLAPIYDYGAADKAVQSDARALHDASDKTQGKAGLGDKFDKGLTLGGNDELSGVVGAGMNIVESPFTGKFDPGHAYEVSRDAQRMRDEDATKRTGMLGTGAEVLGSLMIPGGGAEGFAGKTIPEMIGAGAKTGAKYGLAAGYLSGEGAQDSLAKGAIGGVGGAVLGGGLTPLAARAGRLPQMLGIKPRAAPPIDEVNGAAVAAAGDRMNVPVSAPMVAPSTRNAAMYLEANPGGGPIRASLDATAKGIEDEAGKLGKDGIALTPEMAGSSIREASDRYIENSRGIAKKLYGKASILSNGVTVRSQQAVDTLDQHIAELNKNPNTNKAEIAYLNTVRSDLVDKSGNIIPKTVDDLRQLRTNLRGSINQANLTMSGAERRVNQVLDAATQDMGATLRTMAPEAADAYAKADAFYKDRMTYISDVVQRFVGKKNNPKSGEQVFQAFENMTKPRGDNRRAVAMLKSLSDEERADVAATIADQLGRKNGEADFSPAYFVSQAARISPKARIAVFGADGARDIQALVTLSKAHQAAVGRLNNTRSGVVGQYGKLITSVLIGGGTGTVIAGPVGGVIGAAGSALAAMGSKNIAARVLMSKGFAQWLAKAPVSDNPKLVARHIAELGRIAAANPAVQGDIAALQQALTGAVNDNAVIGRAAASGEEGQNQQEGR